MVDDPSEMPISGEHRLGPSLVVVVLVLLPALLPDHTFERAIWGGLAGLAIILLIAVVMTDPGRIDRRSGVTRWLSIALTLVLVAASSGAAISLVVELVDGAPQFQNAEALLVTGALVWVDVALTFALLFWELDCGGAAGRLHYGRKHPEFAFPEDINPDLAVAGWRPTIVDYLYLAFTNATAFSPTDVMPMRRWAKMVMTMQAAISLILLSLVIANAVNVL